ncbi:hypothetical protein WMY93_002659 [Mugilogobius chulae]|uniref:Uncharacterized protein n=1 Tax=Mugilogobius chulae TaxID=88201 RepID=A0AAW0PU61_9GOBI
MSQQSVLSSFFADDPFFSQDGLLWPLRTEALSSIQQDFFNRRAKLADSLFTELHDGPHLPLMSSAFPRLSNGEQHKDLSCVNQNKELQQASQKNGDLLVTLDARGYAPSDITDGLHAEDRAAPSPGPQRPVLLSHGQRQLGSTPLQPNSQSQRRRRGGKGEGGGGPRKVQELTGVPHQKGERPN